MIPRLLNRGRLAVLVPLVLPCSQPAEPARVDRCLAQNPTQRWPLPRAFREVSGLALSDDGRLFFHGDEEGVLAALDPERGHVVGSYRLGPVTPRDDFEGIAIAGPRLFLVSSGGRLYEARVPPAGPANLGILPFQATATGLGRWCEIEGLGYDARDRVLLIACKNPRIRALERTLTVFRWSVDSNRLATPDRVSVPLEALARGRPGRDFHATGIERDPLTGRFLVVAAPDRAIAELEPDGRVVAARELGRRHHQAEGIAITKNGAVIISDEGAGGVGMVTVYACR